MKANGLPWLVGPKSALLRWQFLPGREDTGTVISSSSTSSAPTGHRCPREVIAAAVRWYLRHGLSYRDVEERVIDEFAPKARHVLEQYPNNVVEADHSRLVSPDVEKSLYQPDFLPLRVAACPAMPSGTD